MLDYHLHLWPHGERAAGPTLDHLAAYCERAAAEGVHEVALTEHLFRFVQADALLGGFWVDAEEKGASAELCEDMATYWDAHATADLDRYVDVVLQAKAAGLPVVLGLEVDYYPDRMDDVARLLAGYPFDVLLGSVHWLGVWMFDDLDSQVAMAEYDRRSVEQVWDEYTRALEELAATGTCDVLAHPDLCKVTGRRPAVPGEFHARMAEAAVSSGMAAEVSSAGWRKPAAEAYPAPELLGRFAAAGVPITTASDAHREPDVAMRAADLRSLVTAAGYTSVTGFRERKPQPVPLVVPEAADVVGGA